MRITRALKQKLNTHLQEKTTNYSWLSHYLYSESPVSATHFPYHITDKKVATLSRKSSIPTSMTAFSGINTSSSHSCFVLNIPYFLPPSHEESYATYTSKVEHIRDSAFGTTSEASQVATKNRLAVIIGFNRPSSIDNSFNRRFHRYVKKLPRVEGVYLRALGFLWEPHWSRRPGVSSKFLYEKDTAFKVLKALFTTKAEEVRKDLEGENLNSLSLKAQIPYQRCRQKIKNHMFTREALETLHSKRRNSHSYLMPFDNDFIDLRPPGQQGVLTEYNKEIKTFSESTECPPDLISMGYAAASSEPPLTQCSVFTDMKVREAMAQIIPLAPYYPEPSMGVRVDRDFKQLAISFVSNGGSLESRRFIFNGISQGLLDSNRFVFKSGKGLVTDTTRMNTKKSTRITKVSSVNIGQKQLLMGIRGGSQSHLLTRSWAEQLYLALPIKCVKTDITKHLMKLYSHTNPIDLAYGYNPMETYNSSFFDATLRNFRSYLLNFASALEDPTQKGKYAMDYASECTKSKKEKDRLKDQFLMRIDSSFVALNSLEKKFKEKGLDSEDLLSDIKDIALISGRVTGRFHLNYLDIMQPPSEWFLGMSGPSML
jgi:hypothetical protein